MTKRYFPTIQDLIMRIVYHERGGFTYGMTGSEVAKELEFLLGVKIPTNTVRNQLHALKKKGCVVIRNIEGLGRTGFWRYNGNTKRAEVEG